MSPAALEARKFLHGLHNGVLSTISARLSGYPFGSITPFVLDHAGNLLILISTIAEHTKNIQADRRVSLIAFDSNSTDMQASARLTLVGDATIAPNDAALRARYLRYFPQAENYFDMHDFQFYRIAVKQARYIGGFGNIHWIPGEELLPPANQLAEQEAAILDHMNADHAENLRAYCRHVHGLEAENVAMTGIDTDGFDVTADGKLLRFGFDEPVADAAMARVALVALAKTCRA
jgi:putative heme iron utilization protein